MTRDIAHALETSANINGRCNASIYWASSFCPLTSRVAVELTDIRSIIMPGHVSTLVPRALALKAHVLIELNFLIVMFRSRHGWWVLRSLTWHPCAQA